MRAISTIAVVAALAAHCAVAQQAPPPGSPAAAGAPGRPSDPIVVQTAPIPLDLTPLSQEFQASMANSQLQTYRYSQLTEQALALKKLCDTGFGPSDICPKARTAPDGSVPAESSSLPTVQEIAGSRSELTAVLSFADGRRMRVRPGSVLPDGGSVTAVGRDAVRLGRSPGKDTVLIFAGGVTTK